MSYPEPYHHHPSKVFLEFFINFNWDVYMFILSRYHQKSRELYREARSLISSFTIISQLFITFDLLTFKYLHTHPIVARIDISRYFLNIFCCLLFWWLDLLKAFMNFLTQFVSSVSAIHIYWYEVVCCLMLIETREYVQIFRNRHVINVINSSINYYFRIISL